MAAGGNERELVMTRLRIRLGANRLQADCDHLLDEASRLDHPSWVDALTRAALCIRHLGGLARRDDAGALFRNDLSPTSQAAEAQRRIISALSLSVPDGERTPLEQA